MAPVVLLLRGAVHSTDYAIKDGQSVHLSVCHMPVLCQNG